MMTWYDDVVMRTIIELPGDQLAALEGLCRREGISRAEAIRCAVSAHLEAAQVSDAHEAFGLWRKRGTDGLTYEARLRREWNGRRTRRR